MARFVDNSVILNLLCWNGTLFSVKLIPKKIKSLNKFHLFLLQNLDFDGIKGFPSVLISCA